MISEKELEATLLVSEIEEEEEFDPDEDLLLRMRAIMKKSSILLSFISDENFCKSLTKQNRRVIGEHADAIDSLILEVDVVLADDEDEEEQG
jgi:hypothetical protein